MKPIKGKPCVCLLAKATSDESWLWHRRISHLKFKDINKPVLGDIVQGLPPLRYEKDHLCSTCEMGKKIRKIHSSIMNTKKVEQLELLNIDL